MLDDACRHKRQLTYFPFRWMVGTFQEILDSSPGNSARIKSMTDLRVLAFTGSCEAKYSSTELNLGDFSFLLLFFVFISCLGVRAIGSVVLGLSFRNKSSNDRPFPHPKSRKNKCRNENKPSSGGVVWDLFKRTINITDYRNAKNNMNPAKNRTFGRFTHHLIPFP